MIFIVFVCMMFFAYCSYFYARLRLLSPTFISSIMIAVFAGIYCMYIFRVKNDISIKTAAIIICYIICISVAEYIGNRIIFSKNKNGFISMQTSNMEISHLVTFVIFALMLYTGIDRFSRLYQFTTLIGNSDIANTIASARVYVTGVKTWNSSHINAP